LSEPVERAANQTIREIERIVQRVSQREPHGMELEVSHSAQ
jgi:hypothetical protein